MAINDIRRAKEELLKCKGNNHPWEGFSDILLRKTGGYAAYQICPRCGKTRKKNFSTAKRPISNWTYPAGDDELYRHNTTNFTKGDANSELLRRALKK